MVTGRCTGAANMLAVKKSDAELTEALESRSVWVRMAAEPDVAVTRLLAAEIRELVYTGSGASCVATPCSSIFGSAV